MPKDERFDRMERTEWIDMSRIHGTQVFVAGAGALGNEVVKNLVLAGFRDITVADPDTVERSNLSRCVLFREESVGRNKAEVIAETAAELYP
ncbi:MAG: ThiF family adenylyltransferase, partial [Methanomethylophilus sp.]|nr:ThiF family adenylyltransferase [Methanomethylophilus sp.]